MEQTGVLASNKDYKAIQTLFKNERNELILAQRISDGIRVVIKQSLLHDGNIQTASKLGHEYDILKDLDHKGIPKVFEVLYDGKTVALVQEYFEGTNLRHEIFRKKLSTIEVLDLAIQLADILNYIHQKGIIHKDINSSNLILAADGTLKLLDFGISSNLHSETNDVLNVDQIEGTLIYISPEQTGRTAYSVTHSCDFYSMGVLLYELLAGKPPFDSIDPLEIIHFHLSRNPIPLSSILPDLPKALNQLILKLMEKNPDDRYHSAMGIKADLLIIRKNLDLQDPLNDFKAGQNDVNEHYKQNQKLYGREYEISELLSYYNTLNEIRSMLVLVAGYSGVGKSVLIRHIKYPIIQNQGIFISGKFDQFKKDIPYYAFIEGFQEFIKTILSEPEEKITLWKKRISSALGNNAALITEVIPLLSSLMDQQPAVPKLQPAEQEARFHMVMLDFIYAFSTIEQPLVLFIDDLQWADLSSLNLIKRIMENQRQENILVLGAYRDNEIDKAHPLLITLNQIGELKGRIKTLHIKPLNEETTCQIVSDSFGMEKSVADDLGKHVFEKTKGNPFFIHSFLKSLYDKKLIAKDPANSWVWDQDVIGKLEYTDNVIDLMTEGLCNLPNNTQEVLKYAAVLGNTFSLRDLSEITETSQVNVYNILNPAIKGGYINTNNNRYRSLALSSIGANSEIELQLAAKTIQFTFSHDKVQQAAYNLISHSELASLHLRIGRLLIKSKDEAKLNEDIFELLNHFAISSHLIESPEEKKIIAEICLTAGRKAKDSTSYNLAVHYLEIAKNLLGSNSWSENYELTFNVFFELGECEYLNDHPEIAEKYFREVLGYSRTNFEKLKVYYVHSSLYLKIGNTSESLRIGLEAATLYNIRFPKQKGAIQIKALLVLAKFLFLFSTKYRNPESLFNLKDCTDEEMIMLNKFLIDLATSAYQQDQNLMMLVIFKIVTLYIRHGFTDASGWGFSGFSVVVLSALKLQKRGFRLWDITMKLHQRTHSPLIKWRLGYTVLAFYNPWRVPLRDGTDKILETIKACVLNGDQIFTGYSVAMYIRTRFTSGENLKIILETSKDHLSMIRNIHGGKDQIESVYQLIKALNGQTKTDSWDDDTFSGEATLQRLNNEGNLTKLAFYHTSRIIFLYFSERYNEAIEESRILQKYSASFLGEQFEAQLAFYTSLSISAGYDIISPADKKKYRAEFRKNLRNMKLWAKGCPDNFIQHYLLLQAEYYAVENKFEKALQLYEKSILKASGNGSKYVEAIANERAAMLCSKNRLTKQNNLYLEAAWNAYSNWGANMKCRQLETNYPKLFGTKTIQPEVQEKLTNISGTSGSNSKALDLASVLKASQSIASQVKYTDLLKKLMHITIESAGAARGCLLLLKNQQLCIEAIGISGNPDIEIFPSVPVEQLEILPKSVLNYCRRTGESVAIDDAAKEERFGSDTYIQANNILSVLCLPITSLGKTDGLLYLENGLIKGVFTKNRIELLQMLTGQIGISIQNAILYENLEEKVAERTREIEKAYSELKNTQAQLIQAEKMASLGELTAGIAHEIQNPLNFVKNFSEVSMELLDEMKEELTNGRVNEATEIAGDVIQNLERINHHGKRADAIVKGMLQHSRTGSGKKEPTDINALANEYLQLAYHGLRAKDKSFNATMKTDFDESIGKLDIIPQDMGRVILNLLTNAFYAVNEKKKSNIEGFMPVVTVSTKKVKTKVELKVGDNGNGIPQSARGKIFQPFFTTKPTGQGTGLGLSLSYDIVTKGHGGELQFQTKEGEGTVFIVQLPV